MGKDGKSVIFIWVNDEDKAKIVKASHRCEENTAVFCRRVLIAEANAVLNKGE